MYALEEQAEVIIFVSMGREFRNRPFSYSTKSLDRGISLNNFIREVRLSCVRASIAIVHIRKFY